MAMTGVCAVHKMQTYEKADYDKMIFVKCFLSNDVLVLADNRIQTSYKARLLIKHLPIVLKFLEKLSMLETSLEPIVS